MKGIAEYLRRIGKARGFGIQSPWAFRFVTEVIGERWPYYAYEDIDRMYTTRRERRYRKLMLRVRNDIYPNKLVERDISEIDDGVIANDAVLCGVHGAIVVSGIYRDKKSREAWMKMRENPCIGVTFDLYDLAICFLDTSIYKQHYILTF